MHYYAQKSLWMDSTIFTKWFHQQFVPECRKALNEKGIAPKALLVLDNAPSHPDISSISSDDGKITCLYLPPNTTSLLQPMVQGVLQTLKCLYKCDLLLCMLDEECNGSMNIVQFSKTINIKVAVLMSAKRWSEVESETITKSWNKLLSVPDSAQEQTVSVSARAEIDMILDSCDISPAERADWLTSDYHDTGYHDEEIVAYTRGVDGDEESEDDEGESPPMVSHSEACCALESVLAYLEQQPGVPVSTTVTINSLLVEGAKKRSKKQTKITEYFTHD